MNVAEHNNALARFCAGAFTGPGGEASYTDAWDSDETVPPLHQVADFQWLSFLGAVDLLFRDDRFGSLIRKAAVAYDNGTAAVPRGPGLAFLHTLSFLLRAGLKSPDKPEYLLMIARELQVTAGSHAGLCSDYAHTQAVAATAAAAGIDRDDLGDLNPFLGETVIAWQRFLWAAECAETGTLILAPHVPAPLTDNVDDAVATAMLVACNQPHLYQEPALARQLAASSDRLLHVGVESIAHFRTTLLHPEPELAAQLASEARSSRKYLLDHVAIVHTDGTSGVRRIILSPEVRIPGGGVSLGYLIDHDDGMFYGTTLVYAEPSQVRYGGLLGEMVSELRAATTSIPVMLQIAGKETESGSDVQNGHYFDDIAAIELLVIAAWRDLVVPDVREQQYLAETLRKVKEGRAAKAAKKGDYRIVRYIPRRVVRRDETQRARSDDGQRVLSRPFQVGAFVRELPFGQRRSADADLLARDISLPLAAHQTVVRAHWRGSTPEERAAAEASSGLPIKEWRSWSAVDLLRTRTPGSALTDDG